MISIYTRLNLRHTLLCKDPLNYFNVFIISHMTDDKLTTAMYKLHTEGIDNNGSE